MCKLILYRTQDDHYLESIVEELSSQANSPCQWLNIAQFLLHVRFINTINAQLSTLKVAGKSTFSLDNEI